MVVELKNIYKKFKWLFLAFFCILLIGMFIFSFDYFYWKHQQKQIFSNIEHVNYSKTTTFDENKLNDITETIRGQGVISSLKEEKTSTIIPAYSKVRLPFSTYCLDSNYDVPDKNIPAIFYYDKIDMPLFTELVSYLLNHPQIEQTLVQEIFWNLSAHEQFKFDDLVEEQQRFLLKVEPHADKVIDSYQYYKDIDVKNFDFGRNFTGTTAPQRIDDSQLYAKITDETGYGYTELEIYNPTDKDQLFSLIRENSEILVFTRPGWVKKIKIYSHNGEQNEIDFDVIVGKFNLVDNNIVTEFNEGAIIRFPDNRIMNLMPNSKYNINTLSKNGANGGEMKKPPWVKDRSWLDEIFWKIESKKPNKFQIKTLISTTGVRG